MMEMYKIVKKNIIIIIKRIKEKTQGGIKLKTAGEKKKKHVFIFFV